MRFGSLFKVFCTAVCFLDFGGGLFAGNIPIKVDSTNGTATIYVPRKSRRIILEVKDSRTSQWRTFKNLQIHLTPSVLQVALPNGFQLKSWRASTERDSITPIKAKYPEKFLGGKKVFQRSLASSYEAESHDADPFVQSRSVLIAPNRSAITGDSSSASTASLPSVASTRPNPEVAESDIWKVEGSTAYFFNQYRGLQVIDLSDPAHPVLKAYHRLPARGSDLYVTPANNGGKNVMLITHENDGTTGITLLNVDGSSVRRVSFQSVQGWMADSRMVGNRLYIVTQNWGWCWPSGCVSSLNEVVVDSASGSLSAANRFSVNGAWPVIAAGGDWLAIATSDWSDWQTSKITLFSLGDEGALKTMDAVPLFGRLYDKDHMGYEGGRFSAVSERWVPPDENQDSQWWNRTRVTKLQNFSNDGVTLGELEIQRGETLYAAKFSGNKAYVVTALQTDPLFVVDLSDPTHPSLAGQLEVPGRSTRIVPVSNDKLFTVGFDENNMVCASLFCVADPSNPSLLGRVSLGGRHGYSEATHDDNALKVLPDSGVAFLPYTSFTDSWEARQYVQILKLDCNAGTLALGGTITNRFDPLRASILGTTAVSISQKDLVTADVSDPDSPTILADLLLSWPVNRIIESGNFLLQISDGSCWFGGPPSLVVTQNDDADSVLGEFSLGEGRIRDAAVTDGTLRILRQRSSSLVLDVYGLASLPDLSLLGSATATLEGDSGNILVGRMLAPSSNCVVSVVQSGPQRRFGWGYPYVDIDPTFQDRMIKSSGQMSRASVIPATSVACRPVNLTNQWAVLGRNSRPARAVIFNISNPLAPLSLPSVSLTDTNSSSVSFSDAGGGILVVGYAEGEVPELWRSFRYCPVMPIDNEVGSLVSALPLRAAGQQLISSARHRFRILDLQDPSAPVLGPVQNLPGKLLAVSDLTRDGFLAWTETCGANRQIQVSACTGNLVSQISTVDIDFGSPIAAVNRSIFIGSLADNGSMIAKSALSETASLQASGALQLSWIPSTLRAVGSGTSVTLTGADGVRLFSSLWGPSGPSDAPLVDRNASVRFDPARLLPLSGGGIAVPEGDYGAELFLP